MASSVSLDQLRAVVRPMLDERSAADALAAYYALYHSADRTDLFVYPSEAATGVVRPRGFLVRARTGMDLFRPLVTAHIHDDETAHALYEQGLIAGRPAYLTVPEDGARWANKYLQISDAELHRIYRYMPEKYVPEINVLVVTSTSADGLPRCEIRAGDRAGAVAGVNWQSPRYSEIYVYTEPAVRGRGWGKAVVRCLVGLILKGGRTPLYVVSESNEYSIRLAEAVGFEDVGRREFVAQAVRSANG
jgi:ribosomal protein S18 acetylase RimI-like enzyme